MSYRVQFTISDEQKIKLEEDMRKDGYPNISELCKARACGDRSYASLYKQLIERIDKLEPGTTFIIRDLIDTPPALIGRWLYQNVDSGEVKNVIHDCSVFNLNYYLFCINRCYPSQHIVFIKI